MSLKLGFRNAGGRGWDKVILAVVLFAVSLHFAGAGHCADLFGGGRSSQFTFYYSVEGYGSSGRFNEPAAMTLDERNGLIYVADQKEGVVDAFSLQGVAKFQFGPKNGLKAPVGLAVDRSGNVYVSEAAGGPIKIINARSEVTLLPVPEDKDNKGESPKPGRMTIDRDGNLCVVDRANQQVIVFDRERKLKFRFGGIGDKRGEFKLLQDVAVDRQGRIFTADAIGPMPVQVFDRKGGFLYSFGVRGKSVDGLSFPASLFVDRHDQVWVVDKNEHGLRVFDRSGMFLRSFGEYGQGEGSLFYPIAAVQDTLGRVFVLEFGTRRLQVFTINRPFEPFTP